MNYTILELSSTGFKSKEGWFTCDKFKVLSKPIFKGLKVGDVITNIQFKDKYVISFDFPKLTNVELEGVSPKPTVSTPSIQDIIRYSQCVNIAFNSFDKGIDLEFKDGIFIKKGFDLADKIYEEFSKRVR